MVVAGAKSVLIGGGTGFVGSALGRALTKVGYNVQIVSRKPGPYTISWNELLNKGLPKNCKAVVNTAGQNVFDKSKQWTEGFKQDVYSSRVNTTAMLAETIDNAEEKPEVFISMSGVGYYKPDPVIEYTEDSPGGNFDFMSELARDWESSTKLKSASNVRTVIVRSGIVLGRQGGMISELYWPFFMGLGGPVGTGKQYFPWIHVSDLVGLILFSIEKNNVTGILNGVAPQIITNRQFATAFGKALWRPAIIPLPVFILNQLFSPDRAKIMTEGQRVLPKRVLEYGFTYDYPDINSACKACSSITYPMES